MMAERRGFLRGLVSLPLIGGGVTLIGRPSAVAVPVTTDLQDRYIAWLAHEHRQALCERYAEQGVRIGRLVPMFYFPAAPDIEAAVYAAPPSSRAAVVLSAVGCGLRWRDAQSDYLRFDQYGVPSFGPHRGGMRVCHARLPARLSRTIDVRLAAVGHRVRAAGDDYERSERTPVDSLIHHCELLIATRELHEIGRAMADLDGRLA
jgi:hypothetical protein